MSFVERGKYSKSSRGDAARAEIILEEQDDAEQEETGEIQAETLDNSVVESTKRVIRLFESGIMVDRCEGELVLDGIVLTK